MMRRKTAALAMIGLTMATGQAAPALAEVPLIPRAALFDNPVRSNAQISPDGKLLSWLAPLNGVMNVWIAPVNKPAKARSLTVASERPIRDYFWSADSQTLLFLQDRGGDEDFQLFAVSIESGNERALTPFDKTRVQVLGVSRRVPGSIVIGLNNRDRRWHDLHRLDLATGALTEILRNPGNFDRFEIDDDLRPRLAARGNPGGGHDMHRIIDGKIEDKPFTSTTLEDSMTTRPIGFTADGKTLYWRDSRERETAALFAQDFASGQTRLLAQDPRADIGETLRDPLTGEIQAYAVDYLRSQWKALDPAIGKRIDRLKARLKGDIFIQSRSDNDRHWVLVEDAVTSPPRVWLHDGKTNALKLLYTTRPQLDGAPLQPMHPLVLRSRDGLDLPSYLTLPAGSDSDADGKPDAPVPMVLLVHGGPWTRDTFGFDRGHQWLANRGYGVLSVNFRGSTGFGKSFTNAGNQQWGRKMQDDLTDAVQWAVSSGVARPGKVAIMGGSYGGYATLAGLTFTPDAYTCGVDVVGPSNIESLLKAIPPYWTARRSQFAQRVGDIDTEEGRAMLRERSPLNFVDRIAKPLLIGQGANDPRVPQAESDRVVAAMKARNLPVTYVLFPDEGHGFAKPRNNLAFNAVVENFLATCLGGRAEPIGDAIGQSSAKIKEGAEHVPGLKDLQAR